MISQKFGEKAIENIKKMTDISIDKKYSKLKKAKIWKEKY